MNYEYIEGILREMNISKRELARRVGVPASTITAAFRRKSKNIPFETILKIADVLGVAWPNIMDSRRMLKEKAVLANAIDNHIFPSAEEADKTLWDNMNKGSVSRGHGEMIDSFGENNQRDMLLSAFDTLNDDGQTEAVKRVQELGEIPRYRKEM